MTCNSDFQIALIADRHVIAGAHVTLASALRRLHYSGSDVMIHFLSKDWTTDDQEQLRATVTDICPLAQILFHNPDDTMNYNFRPAVGTTLNYALFDLPNRLTGKVLFLDCDLLVMTDLSPVLRANLCGHIAAGVSWETLHRSSDKILFRELGIPLDSPHINCGVLLIDCDAWRAERIGMKCRILREKFDSLLIGGNQPVVNAVLHRRIKLLERRFNTPVSPHRRLSCAHLSQDRVWHLIGRPKPWHPLGTTLHCLGGLFAAELAGTSIARTWRPPRGLSAIKTMFRYFPSYVRCLAARACVNAWD